MAEFTGKKMLVGGNWKSNGTVASVKELCALLNTLAVPGNVEVVVAPMSLHTGLVQAELTNAKVQVAAQNVSATGPGAYTGEVSAGALKDCGIGWALTGHSERRKAGETSAQTAAKTKAAVVGGLQVMACIGEELEARQNGTTLDVVLNDHLAALTDALSPAEWASVAVAYEPVWAIGTGLTASPAQAQEVHAAIRAYLAAKLGPEAAQAVRIMYGVSVKAASAPELGACADVDGFLVGGAALTKEFLGIVAACPAP